MIRTLEKIVFGLRTPILIAIALFTILMAYFSSGLKMDPGIEKMWPEHHEYVDTFRQYQSSLPGAKRIAVVLSSNDATPGSMWTPAFLATLNGVTQDLFFIPGIDRKTVTSLWTPNTRFFEITEEGISADDVIGGKTTPSTIEQPGTIERVQNNTIRGGFVGRLVSNDFTSAMVTAEILEFDPSTGEKLDFYEFNDRLETTIRQRFEQPGGPGFWYVTDRLNDLLKKAQAECPRPSEGFFGELVRDAQGVFGGGETYIPAECGDYAAALKAQLPTMELNYGPVVGSYYPTFKSKLDEIISRKLSPAEQYAAINAEIETWRSAVAGEAAPYRVHIIGSAKALADIGNGAREVFVFFAVAFVLTVAAVWWYCRSWPLTFLTVGCSLVSVVWQFGMIALLGIGLDPLAILVPFLVFAIGVSHGIQQMNLLTDGLSQGMNANQAARYSFSGLLIPGTMALITTLVGFGTLYLVPIPMVKELAIASSIGVALKIITNLIMLPLVASLLKFGGDYQRIVQLQRARAKRVVATFGVIAEPKVAMPLFAGSLILLCFAVYFGLQRQIGDVHAGMPELKQDHRYNVDAQKVASSFNQALDVFTVIVETPAQSCIKYGYMDYLDRLSWRLANVPGVVTVVSAPVLAKQLNAGWYEGNLKWRGLPQNQFSLVQATGPIPSTAGVLNAECTLMPIHVFLENGKAETIARVVAAVKEWRETKSIPPALNKGVDEHGGRWLLKPADLDGLTYTAQLKDDTTPQELTLTVAGLKTTPGAAGEEPKREQIFSVAVPVKPGAAGASQPLDLKAALAGQPLDKADAIEVSGAEESIHIRLAAGNSGIAAAVNEEIHEQELPMTLIVYAVIILLVIFTFFDWRATLCCTVPLTLATFFGYWFMYAMGIGLKVSTLPVMVLAVGIGVDYAYYIYDRLQHFLAEGDDITTAYKKTMEKTGMAVVFTAITLAIGVSTWSFSGLKFQADMGMLLTFMFLINMFNAVTVLPAMAVTLDKLIPRRSRPRLHGLAAVEGMQHH